MQFFRANKATLRPVKKHATSKRNTLSAYTKRTLGSGNLRAAVSLPSNEDKPVFASHCAAVGINSTRTTTLSAS